MESTVKYFGQYLVSKKIISEDILAATLVEQLVSLPSALEIAHRKKLLTSAEILNVLAFQFERKVEFRQACVELGLWAPGVESEIKQELENIRVPLGHLLIKKGAVDLTTITKSLDDFLSRIEVPSLAQTAAANVITQKVSAEVPAEVKSSAHQIDQVLLDEFTGFMSDEKIENLMTLFTMLKDQATDSDMARPLLTEMLVDVHSLRGLMRCIQIEKSSALMEGLEILIVRVMDDLKKNSFDLILKLAELGAKSSLLLKPLKESLVKFKSESPWLESAEISNQYKIVMTELVQLNNK